MKRPGDLRRAQRTGRSDSPWRPRRRGVVGVLIAAALALTACGEGSAGQDERPSDRTVVDLAGREVRLPETIDSVATVGLVPPVNSIVFAVGQSEKIVNGPPGGYSETYANYEFLAPHLVDAPELEAAINEPVNDEELLKLAPDVVIASGLEMAEGVADLGIPSVVIDPTDPEGVKESVTLLGEVFDQQEHAADYVAYFDKAVRRLKDTSAELGEPGEPTLLYVSVSDPIRRPSRTIDWGAQMLGAASVTADVTRDGWYEFGVEQILDWDPEVIIAMFPSDKETLMTDPRFASLQAVQNDRIHVTPTGAQLWGQTTSENPLGLLWLAKTVRPERTEDLDMTEETRDFYDRFFQVELTDDEIQTMLEPNA